MLEFVIFAVIVESRIATNRYRGLCFVDVHQEEIIENAVLYYCKRIEVSCVIRYLKPLKKNALREK